MCWEVSQSIVLSSRTVRLCSPRRGWWSGHWRTTWSTFFFAETYSQVAEGAIPHLCKERKRPTLVRRRKSGLTLFLPFQEGGWRWLRWKYGVSDFCPTIPPSIDDPPTAPHVCCCCHMNWWVFAMRVQMDVTIWDAVHLHSMDRWALRGAGVQAPRHGVLETVLLLWDEAQQVGCLRV